MEESTTDAVVQDQALEVAQPEGQLAEAATTDSESTTTPDQTGSEETVETATSDDDDLSDYWAKKGIDINTPEGQAKAAKSYREAEKAMTQKAQQASALEKQINAQPLEVNTDNELVKQFAQKQSELETKMAVREWKAANNITPEQDDALGKYVLDNPDKAYLLKNGFLTYDDVFRMSGVGATDPSAAKKQGSKEALQDVANKQRTTAINGGASRPAPAIKESPIASVWSNDD